ncbi:MAG: PRC-barrel domain-containing protein [Xanthobacteraceae bacterium]
MSLYGPIRCNDAVCTTSTEDYLRHTGFSPALRALLIFVAVAVLSGLLLVAWDGRPALSQAVKLVTVDVNVVGQGYRISKLTGSSVTNEKDEKIGHIDDFVVARDRSLFAVLQVGGFLGMGGHLVAVPYESLVIDDEGRAIRLPGASKEELKRLPEIKYRG